MTQEEQKLKDFLVSKGAFDAYMRNIQSKDCKGVRSIDGYTPDKYGEIFLISEAFAWSETPEGFDYWYNLFDEYNNSI